MTAPAVIPDDHPCLRCGYSLRGLSPAGVCPECGASIVESLRGALLRYSDPAYLGALSQGAMIAFIAPLSLIVALVCIFPYVAFFPLAGDLAILAIQIACAIYLWSWWRLTTPDPSRVEVGRMDHSRIAARIATVVLAVAWLIGLTLTVHLAAAATGPGVNQVRGLLLFGAVVVAAFFIAAMLRTRNLARRLGDPRVARRAGELLIIAPAAIAAPMILGVLAIFVGGVVRWFFAAAIFPMFLVLSLYSVVVYCVVMCRLWLGLRRELRAQLRRAAGPRRESPELSEARPVERV